MIHRQLAFLFSAGLVAVATACTQSPTRSRRRPSQPPRRPGEPPRRRRDQTGRDDPRGEERDQGRHAVRHRQGDDRDVRRNGHGLHGGKKIEVMTGEKKTHSFSLDDKNVSYSVDATVAVGKRVTVTDETGTDKVRRVTVKLGGNGSLLRASALAGRPESVDARDAPAVRSGLRLELVFLELVVDRLQADAEELGRHALVPVHGEKGRREDFSLDGLERLADADRNRRPSLPVHAGRNWLGGARVHEDRLGGLDLDRGRVAQDVRPVDGVPELAHVSGQLWPDSASSARVSNDEKPRPSFSSICERK